MISLIACDSEMYSASVVNKDISDCNLDSHSDSVQDSYEEQEFCLTRLD